MITVLLYIIESLIGVALGYGITYAVSHLIRNRRRISRSREIPIGHIDEE